MATNSSEDGGLWITLALVVKTQGRHGEVAVELHSDVPGRFRQGMRLSALLKSGERRELEIEELWPHKSWLVLKFAGVETITDSGALKGAELQVPRSRAGRTRTGLDVPERSDRLHGVRCRAAKSARLPTWCSGQEKRRCWWSKVKNRAAKLPYEIPFAEAYLGKLDLAGSRSGCACRKGCSK